LAICHDQRSSETKPVSFDAFNLIQERFAMSSRPRTGLLIDMDGVIYRSHELIPGAAEFIAGLRRLRVPFLFLTNNSQRTRRDVATKLSRMGVPVEERHIFTCAMATARFLSAQKPGGTAFVIGEGGLLNALHANGYAIVDKSPDYVVVGEGRTLTFEMLEQAVQMVLDGAKLIATNLDPNCPTNAGTRPGCGAIVSLIEKATGIEAFSVGKPSPVMMRQARKELGMTTSETVMIGDTMETDILGGVQMGYRTVLVLSGGSRRKDLARYAYQPDLVIDSVAQLAEPGGVLDDVLPPISRDDDTPHDLREWVLTHR
jgi:NagD protein